MRFFARTKGEEPTMRPTALKQALGLTLWLLTLIVPTTPTAAAQSTINYGDNLTLPIACRGSQTLNLAAQAGDSILVHVVETQDFGGVCGGACCCFDQTVTLTDPSMAVLGQVTTGVQGNNCSAAARSRSVLGAVQTSMSGPHTITATDADNNGRGQITLWVQNTKSPARALALPPGGGSFTMPIQLGGAVASYTLQGVRGAQFSATMTATSGSIVPRLDLYDTTTGFPVALPGSGSISATLPSSGQYLLLAYSAVYETGIYQLDVSSSPGTIELFPGSGGLATNVAFDLGLILRPQAPIQNVQVLFNGVDVTPVVASCPATALTSGGISWNCSGLSGALLGPGTHSLEVILTPTMGASMTRGVTWNVFR